jgi:antitoxin ParD1/3/4
MEKAMAAVRKTITLTRAQDDWLKSQITAGRYLNDSEVIRDLIREAAMRDDIGAIRNALIEGERSGISDETLESIRDDVRRSRPGAGGRAL